MRDRNSSTKQANPNNVKNYWQGIIGIFAFHNFFTGGSGQTNFNRLNAEGNTNNSQANAQTNEILIRLRNHHRN